MEKRVALKGQLRGRRTQTAHFGVALKLRRIEMAERVSDIDGGYSIR